MSTGLRFLLQLDISPLTNEGVKLEFPGFSFDPDNDLLTYSATGVPTWATFNPNTKTFSGPWDQ